MPIEAWPIIRNTTTVAGDGIAFSPLIDLQWIVCAAEEEWIN